MCKTLLVTITFVLFCDGSVFPILPPRNLSYHNLNNKTLRVHPLPYANKSFVTSLPSGSVHPPGAVTQTNMKYPIADLLFDQVCGYTSSRCVALNEWGYEFHHFYPGQPGVPPYTTNYTEATYKHPPANRAEALQRVQKYFLYRQNLTQLSGRLFYQLTGHYLYHHYGQMWGNGSVVASEVGENIDSVQLHVAFNRGAARQYGKAWTVDMSPWFEGKVRDYSPKHYWGKASCSTCGHSLSLHERVYFTAFHSGASTVFFEGGTENFFYDTVTNNTLTLSPLGTIAHDFHEFSTRINRGIVYAPIGVVFELRHGMGLGWWYHNKSFDVFPLTTQERLASHVFRLLWPGSFRTMDVPVSTMESQYLVASPHGDIVDVFMETVDPVGVGSSYQLLMLAGDVQLSGLGRWTKYVEQGGVLWVNAAHVVDNAFPAEFLGCKLESDPTVVIPKSVSGVDGWKQYYQHKHVVSVRTCTKPTSSTTPLMWIQATPLMEEEEEQQYPVLLLHSYGKGKIVLSLVENADDDQLLNVTGWGLTVMSKEATPVHVIKGNVQWNVARTEVGWVVLVVNNEGVTKTPPFPARVDNSKKQDILLELQPPYQATKAVDLRSGARLPLQNNRETHFTVGPGQLVVVQFVLTHQTSQL